MPFVRLADRPLIVNPGSIGTPCGAMGLRRTEYDAEAACRFLAERCAYPDVEALRVFSGRGTSST